MSFDVGRYNSAVEERTRMTLKVGEFGKEERISQGLSIFSQEKADGFKVDDSGCTTVVDIMRKRSCKSTHLGVCERVGNSVPNGVSGTP